METNRCVQLGTGARRPLATLLLWLGTTALGSGQALANVQFEFGSYSVKEDAGMVLIGVTRGDDSVTVKPPALTFEEKTLTGSYFGSARPRLDFPRLIGLYQSGRLLLDEMITRRYTLDEAPQAFDDMVSGRNARGVIVFDDVLREAAAAGT